MRPDKLLKTSNKNTNQTLYFRVLINFLQQRVFVTLIFDNKLICSPLLGHYKEMEIM